MLEQIRHFVLENPQSTNFAVAAEFKLTRAMADRFLEHLEDEGTFFLDRPAEVCTGCSPKNTTPPENPCATTNAASQINALATQARTRRTLPKPQP